MGRADGEHTSEAGLVSATRRGREHIDGLESARLGDARRYIDEISRQWAVAVDSLRAFEEGD